MEQELYETVMSPATHQVDAAEGIIRNVKVLGRVSANGRRYSDRAMEDGVRLYEGIKVNIDHPPLEVPGQSRSYVDGFGDLRNLRFVKKSSNGSGQDDGVFGDLHFNRKHHLAEQLVEDAVRFPKNFGLSHNAKGNLTGAEGNEVVESLTVARSVDIVGRPATNKSIFESEGYTMKKKTVKQILESNSQNKGAIRLKNLLEQDPAMMPVAAEPVEVDDGASGDEEVKNALAKAAAGIAKKAVSGEMDKQEAMKKFKELIGLAEKMEAGGAESEAGGDSNGGGDSNDNGEETTAVSESIKEALDELRTERKQWQKERREAEVKTLIESRNVEATGPRVKALVECTDEEIRKELLDSWPKVKKQNFHSPSILESHNEENQRPSWSK